MKTNIVRFGNSISTFLLFSILVGVTACAHYEERQNGNGRDPVTAVRVEINPNGEIELVDSQGKLIEITSLEERPIPPTTIESLQTITIFKGKQNPCWLYLCFYSPAASCGWAYVPDQYCH